MAAIREGVPIKFRNEVIVHQNTSAPRIFTVVYNDYESASAEKAMRIGIEPLGIFQNGILGPLPNGLTVETEELPLTLQGNIPESYGMLISASPDSKPGSYQLALRETINEAIFVETMTVTILGPDEVIP